MNNSQRNNPISDENAQDSFYAQRFFKKRQDCLRDITNDERYVSSGENVINTYEKPPSTFENNIFIKQDVKVNTSLKRESIGSSDDNVNHKMKTIKILNDKSINKILSVDLFEKTNEINSKAYEFVTESSIIDDDFAVNLLNDIVVNETRKCKKLLKVDRFSAVWYFMMDTTKKESRILSTPCRALCSPVEQYSLTPILQYRSHCLIQTYHVNNTIQNSSTESIIIDGIYIDQSSPEYGVNTSHFHDLYLEKLPCNMLCDFMHNHTDLSGSILAGFIDGVFELSQNIGLSNEVTHLAVDYIYQYLDRMQNVLQKDMKLIILGAIWVAYKSKRYSLRREILNFHDCSLNELKLAEINLLTIIDLNLTKPNAINFCNHYLTIEPSSSVITHLSNFILDMTLHSYTIMLFPASKRAASAIWLARLILKFDNMGLNSFENVNLYDESLINVMTSVWPPNYKLQTGYHHSEIAHLAVRMHIVILALLCHGYHSMNACFKKYSMDDFLNWNTRYDKFSSDIVCFGTRLYCHMNDLILSEWLEKNECDILNNSPSLKSENQNDDFEIFSSIDDIMTPGDKRQPQLTDSGYTTCSNLSADSHE